MRRFVGKANKLYLLWMFFLFILLACGGGASSSKDTDSGGSPEIALSSDQILFGNLVVNQTADRSIEVRNSGTADLNVGQVTAPSAPFSVVSDSCSNSVLTPNASCTVMVRFSPVSQDSFVSSLNIPSNDGNRPTLPVAHTGEAKAIGVNICNVTLDCPTTATVTVTVTESDNTPVLGLSASDFSVTLNGDAIAITDFANTQTASVSVALALDLSNSLVEAIGLKKIQSAAIAFIENFQDTDRGNVYKFEEKVDSTDAVSPFLDATSVPGGGKDQLKGRVTRADDLVGRPTYLFDVIDLAIDKTMLETNIRKAVVVVTDGFDNNSGASIDDVIDSANDAGVFIFTIGLGKDVDTENLQRLAQGTGGQYFYAPSGSDLTAIYTQISQILLNQYQFTFSSPLQGDSLKVEVNSGGGNQGEDTVIIPGC